MTRTLTRDQIRATTTLAFSYIRFSTPGQSLGDSLRRQVERTAAYCAEHGLTLDESIRDEGLSGYHGVHRKRGALGRFIARVKAGEIPRGSVLIVEAFDRMDRRVTRQAMAQFLELINAGVEIVTLIDGQRYSAATVDANVGQLFMSIGMMMGAHAESKNKADRIRATWTKRHGDQTNNFPSWFDKFANEVPVTHFKGLPPGTVLEIKADPDKAAIINRIFTMAQTIGVDAIAQTLNAENVPCLSDRKRPRGEPMWDGTPIRNLIRGRQVLGKQPTSKYIDNRQHLTGEFIDAYPTVVSQELWDAANAALDARTKGVATGRNVTQYANLFGDMAVCAACGGRMKILRKGKNADYRYFGCANAGIGKCKAGKYHRLDKVEAAILPRLGVMLTEDKPKVDPSLVIEKRLKTARTEAAAIEKAYAQSMTRTGSLAERTQAKLEADHQDKLTAIDKLERELRAIRAAKPRDQQAAKVRTLASHLKDATGPEKVALRAMIAAALPVLVGKVEFHADGSVIARSKNVPSRCWDVFSPTFPVLLKAPTK